MTRSAHGSPGDPVWRRRGWRRAARSSTEPDESQPACLMSVRKASVRRRRPKGSFTSRKHLAPCGEPPPNASRECTPCQRMALALCRRPRRASRLTGGERLSLRQTAAPRANDGSECLLRRAPLFHMTPLTEARDQRSMPCARKGPDCHTSGIIRRASRGLLVLVVHKK